jgi:prophage antirepressor-like protein
MDLIQAFVLDGTSYTVDTVWQDEEPLFKANDIARVLGIGNIRTSLSTLSDEDKVVILNDTLGGPQQTTYLKEAAAYQIVMRSRKPVARPFQNWLSEVAVAIRRKGAYELEQRKLADEAKRYKEDCAKNKHDALVSAFRGPDRPVVYMGIIDVVDENRHAGIDKVIKIGHTSDVFDRAAKIRHDMGSFRFFEIIDCPKPGCVDLEGYIKSHKELAEYKYTGPIYHGRTSTETFVFSDKLMDTAIAIAKRNLSRFSEKKLNDYPDESKMLAKFSAFLKKVRVEQVSTTSDPNHEQSGGNTDGSSGSGNNNINRTIVYCLPEDRKHTQARGNKVQRYSEDGTTLLKTYPGFADASRDPELDSPVDNMIKQSAANRTVYKGFRWAELDRAAADDTSQDIGTSVEMPTQKKGLVAMIDLNHTSSECSATKGKHQRTVSLRQMRPYLRPSRRVQSLAVTTSRCGFNARKT